jgi:hypothetical protein
VLREDGTVDGPATDDCRQYLRRSRAGLTAVGSEGGH